MNSSPVRVSQDRPHQARLLQCKLPAGSSILPKTTPNLAEILGFPISVQHAGLCVSLVPSILRCFVAYPHMVLSFCKVARTYTFHFVLSRVFWDSQPPAPTPAVFSLPDFCPVFFFFASDFMSCHWQTGQKHIINHSHWITCPGTAKASLEWLTLRAASSFSSKFHDIISIRPWQVANALTGDSQLSVSFFKCFGDGGGRLVLFQHRKRDASSSWKLPVMLKFTCFYCGN